MFVAKEWGKQAMAQATFIGFVTGTLYAMLGAPGDDEEWDFYWNPQHKYFGHIRIGNRYTDLTAGLAQYLSSAVRIFGGTQINRFSTVETDKAQVGGSLLQGKLAPVPSIGSDYIFGPMTPGVEFGSAEWAAGKFTPLYGQEVYQAFDGAKKPSEKALGGMWAMLAFFGQSSRSMEAKTKQRGDVANELRVMKKQGRDDLIEETLSKHLKHTAKLEAKEAIRTAKPEEQAALQKAIDGVDSPELTEAIEKEQYDIILNASARVSTDKHRPSNDEKLEFSGSEDKGRLATRMLVPMMVPDVDDAIKLYDAAYRARNNSLQEKNGQIKASVWAGRARIRQLYKQQQ